MNVLMFGWEFPPHISGGLGTACHGLANALVANGVGVQFVVPKLSGEEISADVKLINASNVLVPETEILEDVPRSYPITGEKDEQRLIDTYSTVISGKSSSAKEVMISPYNYGEVVTPVQQWNYELHSTRKSQTVKVPERQQKPDMNLAVLRRSRSGRKYNLSGTYGADLMREVAEYAEIAKVIAADYQHDVIHAHDWISFPAGIAAKNITGKKLVVHVHATEYDRSGDNINQQVYDYEREGMEIADKVLTVSQWTRQIVINKYNIDPAKVEVIYNGVVRKDKDISSTSSPLGSKIVTFLGRITHQKGPFYFVEAARLVLQKFPDAHFVVVGSGDLLPAMIEFTARLNISAHFHFTGFLKGENIDRIWAVSKVYVMPSVSEPFGLTPLEAMQSGVPVIISKQSGVSEVMQHAIKIDFWDIKSLASAICSILKYKSLSENLKRNSTKEIGKINWDDSAKKIKYIYHELTGTTTELKTTGFVFPDSSADTAA